MPTRKANDAQIERLLQAMRHDLTYRQKLAQRIAEKEGIKYDSAMRRLQRYVTTAGERRSILRAPVDYRREVRQLARTELPPPAPPLRTPEARPVYEPRFDYTRLEAEHTGNYELWAVIAYHDGDTREAGRALGVDSRLLDLSMTGTAITRKMGGGAIDEGIERFYERLPPEDRDEIQAMADYFADVPDWRILMILEDISNGDSTWGDWFDAIAEDDFDIDADESAFWEMWRAAYARAKK